jgi:hypothetical protein
LESSAVFAHPLTLHNEGAVTVSEANVDHWQEVRDTYEDHLRASGVIGRSYM